MIHVMLIALLAAPGIAGITAAITLPILYGRAVRADRGGNTPQG